MDRLGDCSLSHGPTPLLLDCLPGHTSRHLLQDVTDKDACAAEGRLAVTYLGIHHQIASQCFSHRSYAHIRTTVYRANSTFGTNSRKARTTAGGCTAAVKLHRL